MQGMWDKKGNVIRTKNGDYNYIHKYIALGWGLEVQKT